MHSEREDSSPASVTLAPAASPQITRQLKTNPRTFYTKQIPRTSAVELGSVPHLLQSTLSEVKPDSVTSHHQPPAPSPPTPTPNNHQVTGKSLPTWGSSWELAALEKNATRRGGGKKSLAHKRYLFLKEQPPGASWPPSPLQSYVRFLPSIGGTRLLISNQSRGRRKQRQEIYLH